MAAHTVSARLQGRVLACLQNINLTSAFFVCVPVVELAIEERQKLFQ
jgi:hypothetical protein